MGLLEIIVLAVFIIASIGFFIWINIKTNEEIRLYHRTHTMAHYCLMRTLEDARQITEEIINKGDKK